MGVWLFEFLITLAESVDAAVRTAHTWAPAAGVAGALGVAVGWQASGRFRRCLEAYPDTDVRTPVREGVYVDHDIVTGKAPTCTDACPLWCPDTCPDASMRGREGHSDA